MEGNTETYLKLEVDKKNEKYNLEFRFKGNLKVDDNDLANFLLKNKGIQQLNKLN